MGEYQEYLSEHPLCEVCDSPSMECHHIKTRGSGGTDKPENLIAICRRCHVNAHQIGHNKLAEIHPRFKSILKKKGWQFCKLRDKWVRYEAN